MVLWNSGQHNALLVMVANIPGSLFNGEDHMPIPSGYSFHHATHR
jgi:hypothetical protein